MPITDKNAVIQALANVRLESLTVPDEIIELFNKALKDGSIDTNDMLNSLRD
ncbi:MAG: hypothetical protein V3U87_12800 [Methylococcaceae bacterium]